MGRYQVEAALNVAVASEAAESVNSLGNLIKQQNQAQIDQNKLIAKVLKEVTEARKKDKVEIVQVERKQRDVTAGMNDYTAAIVKAKGAIYDTTGVVRNLGESIAKGLTFWAPWVGWITMAVGWLDKLSTWLENANTWTNALYESMDKLSNVKPPDMTKFATGVQALGNTMLSYMEGVNKFGPFVTWKEFAQPDPGIQKNQLVAGLEELAKNAVVAQKMLPDLRRQLAENEISLSGARKEYEKNIKERDQMLSLFDAMNKRASEIRRRGRIVIDPWEQLYLFYEDKVIRPRVETQITKKITEINRQLVPIMELSNANRELAAKILQAEIDTDERTENIYRELQFDMAQIPEENGSGRGKGKGGAGSARDYINKNRYDNLRYFWEKYHAADGEIRKTWLDKLIEERDSDLRKADDEVKNAAAREVARGLVFETFRKNVEKGAAEQTQKVLELLAETDPNTEMLEKLRKEQEKALEVGMLKHKTYERFEPNLSNLSPKEKRELEDFANQLTNTLNKDVEKVYMESRDKMMKNRQEVEKLVDIDLTGLSFEDQKKVIDRIKWLEEEQTKIRQEYLDKRYQASKKYEDGVEELHEKEVKAFADQFRIIDANSEAWKKTDEAMNTTIAAVEMLGVSEKKVFALQNYAKGIEASVDAIKLQADAIEHFGLGDIKGGIALQAAAVSKGIAAYAYFKNSMEMGGKGGSAPSVGTAAVTGREPKDRDVTINMSFEGTAGAIIRPLADAFNAESNVPGGVRLNRNLMRQ